MRYIWGMKVAYLRLISYFILAYTLAGLAWWAYLLVDKNRVALQAEGELLMYEMYEQRRVTNAMDFYTSPDYHQLRQRYQRQEWMIMGEGLLLIASVLAGIGLIRRGYSREIRTTSQQRNFLLSITHELKSPVAGIRLILETFLRRELPSELRERLSNNGLKEVDRLTALVDDLLLSARLEDSYQLNLEALDLAELVTDVADKVSSKYPEATIQTQLHPDLPLMQVDRQGMVSLLTNLIENAAKYAQPQPQVTIHLYRNEVDDVVLTVADNGIGIPDQEKEKVFDKFYRVGSEDTRTTKGTGLGLFIVRELAKRHGGRVRILDNDTHGSIFEVVLPVH